MNVPKHVALIMDGNRRFGVKEIGDKLAGHRAGVERVRDVIKASKDAGVEYLTFYTFSTENWNRSEIEVSTLLGLFREYFSVEIDKMHKEGIRILFIGRRDRLPEDIVTLMEEAETLTKNNKNGTVQFALDYGGRDEIVRAINKLDKNTEVSEADFDEALDTAGVPDPDLVVRTGGEQRLSGFLLWQASYAELYFPEAYWPEFDAGEFNKALKWYGDRDRRHGK